MQHLTATPIVGETPARDPEYGVVYRIIEEYNLVREEILREIWHDSIELVADPPQVFLKLKRRRVATLCMTGMHVDSHLVIRDPSYTG